MRGDLAMGLYAAKNAVFVAAVNHLGSTATRLFVFMALECWDESDNPAGQAARRYFARRESSAIALGFLAPDNGSEAAFLAVKRAVAELTRSGVIVRTRAGGNGHPAEFELMVDSARPPSTRRVSHDLLTAHPDSRQEVIYRTPQGANF
jgi:hypothetical protein